MRIGTLFLGAALATAMAGSGMQIHARTVVRRIARTDAGGFHLELAGPDGECTLAVDRCLLYVFRCACYYARTKRPDPQKLLWWNWKDEAPRRR